MNELMDIRRQCRLNQWSMMVQEREDSGLSIRAYCEQKGIGVKTYYYRLKKLREAAVELTQPEIVQVEAPEILEQKSIIIQSGNTSIEIPGNANPETVRAAVSFLKQPCSICRISKTTTSPAVTLTFAEESMDWHKSSHCNMAMKSMKTACSFSVDEEQTESKPCGFQAMDLYFCTSV